jgi:hypothetical protein
MARRKPRTPPGTGLHWTPERQAACADAVHRAVCDFTGTDGFGACMLYAVAGWSLLVGIEGEAWHLQAGTARMLADPPDGWVEFDGARPGALARGEFHCWVAKQSSRPQGRPAALVDFSSRHVQRMCREMLMAGERLPWSQPPPPPVIWTEGEQSPLIHWEPVPALCLALWEHIRDHHDDNRPLWRLVTTHMQHRLRPPRDLGQH